ncbi:TadE/TadG family type IV pilus assembly protein [Altererythrobacter lutimaris]|uniref:Pilus assembly protein n=1 Tax=Altererythrobacter lutimaris TaxID=2743979 RepID=A0A850H476_9SPHN|nr:TadE/TadG family type IV pilus assembly protein [Altererythrobacter lutimaris]NVE93994.1 pilus assembly protein [Altererythrobacter lutimaris]
MKMPFFKRLERNEEAATIIEFAILAPAFLALLLGVFQIAINMQAMNAMRSVASETARYAVVEYQKKNEITNDDIRTEAERIGESLPYALDRNFSASVSEPFTQRVDGAFEKTLTIRYTPPAVLPFFDWTSQRLNFQRPIFLIDE